MMAGRPGTSGRTPLGPRAPRRYRARRRRTTLRWTCRTCDQGFQDTPSLFHHALGEHQLEATDWEISMSAQRDEASPPWTAPQDPRPLGRRDQHSGSYLYSTAPPVIDLTCDRGGWGYPCQPADHQEEEGYADDTPVVSEEEGSQLEDLEDSQLEDEDSQLGDGDSQLEDEDSQLEDEDSQLEDEDSQLDDGEETPLRYIRVESSTETETESEWESDFDSW